MFKIVPSPPKSLFITLLGISFVCLLSSWLTPKKLPDSPPASIPSFAGRDFPIYWTAWRIAHTEAPLFESASYQRMISDPLEASFSLHNPPWTLILFSPLGGVSYQIALGLWLTFNFACFVFTVFFSLKLFEISLPPPWLLLITAIFPASFSCLYFGQLTILLTCAALVLVVCLKTKNDYWAGFCLSWMTIKPHLFFLFLIPIGLTIIKDRRWAIFTGFLLSFGTILTLLTWIRPLAISDWITWLGSGHATEWSTANLATWVRLLVWHFSNQDILWPVYAIPILSIIVTFFFLLSRNSPKSWIQYFLVLIPLSLILGPYAWSYDFCLLLPWQAALLAPLLTKTSTSTRIGLAIVIGVQLIWILQGTLFSGDMHTFAWFPLIVLLTWLWFSSRFTIIESEDDRG
ncbi:MAG: glycosyltransferase family 87 protein [Verrucomicrobiota bacterium]